MNKLLSGERKKPRDHQGLMRESLTSNLARRTLCDGKATTLILLRVNQRQVTGRKEAPAPTLKSAGAFLCCKIHPINVTSLERKTPQLRGASVNRLSFDGRPNQTVSKLSHLIHSKVNSKFRVRSNYPIPDLYGGHMESLPVSVFCTYFESRAKSGMDSEVPGTRHGAVKNQIPYASKLGSEGQMEAKEWKRSLGLPLPQNFHRRASI